jgi:hypothetical protein
MSNQILYTVIGSNVDSHEHWAIASYTDRETAEQHANSAQEAIDEYAEWLERESVEVEVPRRNPWDPKSYMYPDELFQYYVVKTRTFNDLKHFRLAQG